MTSFSPIFSYKNLSLCVYIGNTTSIDESALLNYCSNFGRINFYSFKKEKFCDFYLIEFSNIEQYDKFLHIKTHEINRIILDIKSYKHILINNDILNIDCKFYFGPILNSKNENLIIEFYKTIDSTLEYYLLKQNNEKYFLFQFNNQQIIRRIFEKQLIPIINDKQKYFLYKPKHPKEFLNRIISIKNKQNQIYIHGLNNQINETMLIEYFHRYAPVIACQILSNNPQCAVMEFNDKKTVRKILEISYIHLQGINLTLNKASHHLASLLSLIDNKDESDHDDDDDEVQTSRPTPTPSLLRTQNPTPLFLLSSNQQNNNIQQSFMNFTSTSPVLIPSPEINESGWSSPPRTVITHSPSIDQTSTPLTSKPNTTTNSINNESTIIDIDIKPIPKIQSNHILRFAEQFRIDLEHIRDEYRLKFNNDQKFLQQEINTLINEERETFNRLNRYLFDHQEHKEKRNKNKRKHSPSSSIQ